MKLKLILFSLLLCSIHAQYAMEDKRIKMPSATVLENRLKSYSQFVERTNIIPKLANKEMTAKEVVTVLDKAFHDYENDLIFEKQNTCTNKQISDTKLAYYLLISKKTILTRLLKEHTEELKKAEQLMLAKKAKL